MCWGNGEQRWLRRMCVDFVHLTCCTTFDVGCNKVFHVRPPVMRSNPGQRVGNSGVTSGFLVMKLCKHPPPKTVVFHDNKGGIFPECVCGIDAELVLFLPFLQGFKGIFLGQADFIFQTWFLIIFVLLFQSSSNLHCSHCTFNAGEASWVRGEGFE